MSMPKRNLLYRQVLERLHEGFSGGIFHCWDETGYYPEKIGQPRDLQLLWAARYCYSDVFNGGFYQFFTNFTGVLAPEAVEGFRMIDLSDGANLVVEAMGYFGHPYPRSQEERTRMLPPSQEDRDDWDPFVELDDKFYERLDDRFDDAANRFVERFLKSAPE